MTVPSALALWQENAGANYHARDYRRFLEGILGFDLTQTPGTASGGIFRAAAMGVTQRGAGANMSVDVASGLVAVRGSQSSTQGVYATYNDATLNVAISASDPSNPRYDIIGVRIRDTEYTAGSNDAAIVVVQGTPAASPAEPALPNNFLTLARVTVGAGVTSITNANILDRRQRLAALGGILPCTSSTRPTVGLTEGVRIWETDTNRDLIHNGNNWVCVTPQAATVTTAQTIGSAGSYVDLTTVGPAVTIPTDTQALVTIGANYNSTQNPTVNLGVAVSGATTLAASDANGYGPDTIVALANGGGSRTLPLTGLTGGNNTFTQKYKASTAAASTSFLNRSIAVVGIP